MRINDLIHKTFFNIIIIINLTAYHALFFSIFQDENKKKMKDFFMISSDANLTLTNFCCRFNVRFPIFSATKKNILLN